MFKITEFEIHSKDNSEYTEKDEIKKEKEKWIEELKKKNEQEKSRPKRLKTAKKRHFRPKLEDCIVQTKIGMAAIITCLKSAKSEAFICQKSAA